MAAQNIGAGKWDRVNAINRAGIIYNTAITLAVIVAIILFDRPVMALFVGSDSPAIPIARHIQLHLELDLRHVRRDDGAVLDGARQWRDRARR